MGALIGLGNPTEPREQLPAHRHTYERGRQYTRLLCGSIETKQRVSHTPQLTHDVRSVELLGHAFWIGLQTTHVMRRCRLDHAQQLSQLAPAGEQLQNDTVFGVTQARIKSETLT